MSKLEIKSAEDVVKEILEGYNRRPKGWQIASDHIGNTLVLGPDIGFRLKMMMINPTENIGVGVRVDDVEELRRNLGSSMSCGFRGLSRGAAREFFSSLRMAQEESGRQEILRNLLQVEPVPTWKLQPRHLGAIFSGPYIAHPDLRMISRKQSELDEKLAREVDKSFRAKYPMRASMFG